MEPVGSQALVGIPAYDPAEVERFFEEAVEERLQLREALDIALARAAAAREALEAVRSLRYCIGATVIEAEERHRKLEADTDRAIREMLAAADAQAEACIANARAEAARGRLAAAVEQINGQPEALPSAAIIDLRDRRVAEAV